MKTFSVSFFCCLFFLTACSQSDTAEAPAPLITQHLIPLSSSAVRVQRTAFAEPSPFLLLQLHSNETTAATVTTAFAQREGVDFIQLRNGLARLVSFRHASKQYAFDPNRIFSHEGIRKTLQLSGRYSEPAFRAVVAFRDSLLRFLSFDKPVVAVHNNRDGSLNILQYRDAGIGAVHVNDTHDADDFFITNDEEIFERLKEEDVNVVLEDAEGMEEDGSLSLYCDRAGLRYINVEAEHGHAQQQTQMLEIIHRILTEKKN